MMQVSRAEMKLDVTWEIVRPERVVLTWLVRSQ